MPIKKKTKVLKKKVQRRKISKSKSKVVKKITKKKLVAKRKTTKRKTTKAKSNKKRTLSKIAENKINRLIETGKVRGFITQDEIIKLFPRIEDDIFIYDEISKRVESNSIKITEHIDMFEELSDVNLPNLLNTSKKHGRRRQSDDLVQMYFRDIGKYPLLSADQEKELSKRIKEGDQNAQQILINSNLRLVASFAAREVNKSPNLTLLDLIQAGNEGLFKAVKNFDHTLGYKFSTYATWWIRQSLTRSRADHSRTIRIPVHMVDSINQYKKVFNMLSQELGRDPLPTEIAVEMGISPEKVRFRQKVNQSTVSMDKSVGSAADDDGKSTLGDLLKDNNIESPDVEASHNILSGQINDILDTLSPRERKVLEMRHGIIDGVSRTLEDVGKEFNVTRERIRQIESKALEKIRKNKDIDRLKNYY